MAGLKTPKKKRDSSKPNTILVIFLVFFILVSIGLGVWGYYGYAGQEKLEAAAKTANTSAKAAKDYAEYAMFVGNEGRLAIGAPANAKGPVLTPDEIQLHTVTREEVIKEGSKYKAEKTYEPLKLLMDTLKADLGGYDDNAKKYNLTYRDIVTKLTDNLKKSGAMLATTQGELKAANDRFATLQTKQENYWKTALKKIDEGNKESLTAATTKYEEMKAQFALNIKLNEDLDDAKKQSSEEQDKLKRQIKKLNEEINKLTTDKTDVAVNAAAKPQAAEFSHPLFLDVSRGKPLWDLPLGKITRVDLQARQVYINLGSANGMQPEVTFNIFGAGWNGRAEKELKGTIEVIRVLDANSSLARITSIYDASGIEIVLADPTRGRPQREAENALKEGDLLFNMFWGTRVAIAGSVQFAGIPSDSPAEQMRTMGTFIHFLGRHGIIVDAYLDLNDGQIKGAITSRTRYLIRGDDLVEAARPNEPRAAVKKEENADPDKKDEAKKEEAPPAAEGAVADRLRTLNDAAAKMRFEAVDKGLLIISTDNFLNVIGYRQPRSATYMEAAGFRPSVISAGQGLRGLDIQGDPKKDGKLPPEMKEKAPEVKAPEGK